MLHSVALRYKLVDKVNFGATLRHIIYFHVLIIYFHVFSCFDSCFDHLAVSITLSLCAHVPLHVLKALCQPVICIFWPIRMQNRLVAANKLRKHRRTAARPYCPFAVLHCDHCLTCRIFLAAT